MGATLSNALAMLREHYHENIAEIFFVSDKSTAPLLASMEAKSKDDGFGRGYVTPFEFGMGSSASASFSVAQGKASGTTVGSSALRDRWVTQAATIDAIARWSRDIWLAAEGKGAGELFDVMTREMDSKISLVKKRLAHSMNEKGFGRVGTILALTSSTITLSTDELNRLDEGDELVAAATESASALRVTANTGNRVTGYNPDTGVVNVAVDPTAGGGAWAVGDTVFFYGDRQDSATPVEIMPYGLPAWVPVTAPGSTLFNGVNRQNRPNLGGHRYASAGASIAATLIKTANRLFNYGSRASICYMSADDYGTLCIDKDQVKTVELKVGKYEIGFDGVTVRTNAGLVPVVPEALMEQGNAWMGPFDDKKYAPFLAHNGDLVNIDEGDNQTVTRISDSSGYEMRMYFRGNMILPAPGKFAVATGLPTA